MKHWLSVIYSLFILVSCGGGGGGGDQPSPLIKTFFGDIGFDESGNGGSRGVGGEFKEKKEDFR